MIRGGARSLRASIATPSEILAAIRALEQAERDSKVAPAERARRERAAVATQRYFRSLGVRRVVAQVVRRGGQVEIALFVPLDVAESLTATPAKTKASPKPLARTTALSRRAPKSASAG